MSRPCSLPFHHILAAIACLTFAVNTANAQIAYQSATRSVAVSADGFCTSPSDSDSSNALGSYSANLSVSADSGGDISFCQASADGTAAQMTDLLPWNIGGEGSASSSGFFGGNASGASTFSVAFSVSDSFPYTLNGTVSGQSEQFFSDGVFEEPGSASVTLSNSSGVIHTAQQTSTAALPFSFSGTLVPGNYTLEARASASAFSDGQDEESFDFQLNVVLVGDFDRDGDIDCDDLDGYVGNLGATVTDELAPLDLNNDGFVSAIDANTHITTLVQTLNNRTGTFRGDLNCDGNVNILGDAFALFGNLGNPATSYSQGDINFDGTVDVLGDAFILIGNLGLTNEP